MRQTSKLNRGFLCSCASVAALAGGFLTAGPAFAEDKNVFPFTPILEARLRYETVDQDGFAEDADALTARLRFGFETPTYNGFSFLADGEMIVPLVDDYNSTTNGHTQFPVVADPDGLELNRAHLTYSSDMGKAVIGRQRIILDNARFVGNVGWRQNEQTYDAALGSLTIVPDLTVTYAYVDKVQRIFGNESAVGEFDSESHLVNAKYTGIPGLAVSGYGYYVDLEEAPAASTQTYGVRAVYRFKPVNDVNVALTGEFANQADYGDNPGDVDLNYYLISAGLKTNGFDASAAYEVLEGDGSAGFSTPLATLHKFQGWADVFLGTPATGIEDMYGRLGYTSGAVGPFKKIIGAVIYHDFEAEQTGAPLGDEIDVLLKAVVNKKLSVTAKYASYDGPTGGPASRDKFWLQVDWKY